jgi:hypothetical protein
MEEMAIRKAADQMIKLHGADADIAASLKADRMLNIGNIAGFYDWNWITAVISVRERKSGQHDSK